MVCVEVFYHKFGLFFRNLESVVNEPPSEVVNVERAVSIFIHCLKNEGKLLKAEGGLLHDFPLEVSNHL